ncbi:NUDIX domain-containing protein [Candidatus Woesearchaeota archaeon]|nr:NUDIX domain-containing protein [Candidatus Woesearchaeota archaeon]
MKLPKQAKKVFSGIMYTVYQWEQKLYDGKTATYEAIKRKSSVQIIPVYENKIILSDEEQPHRGKFTGMIGGQIDAKETPKQAAKRELLEETGMKPTKLIFWKKTNFGKQLNWETHYYVAKNCNKIQEPKPGNGEKIKLKFLTFNELFKETEKPGFRNKSFKEMLFRINHTKGEKEKLRKFLFD